MRLLPPRRTDLKAAQSNFLLKGFFNKKKKKSAAGFDKKSAGRSGCSSTKQ